MKGKILTTGLMGMCVVALCFVLVWVASPEIYEAHGEFAYWWDSVRTDANGKVSQLGAGGNGIYLKEVKRLVDDCRSLSFSSNVLMRFLSEEPSWHNSISSLQESVRGITVLVSELPIPVLTVWVKAKSPELAEGLTRSFLDAIESHVTAGNKKRHVLALKQIHEQVLAQERACESIQKEYIHNGASNDTEKAHLAQALSVSKELLARLKEKEQEALKCGRDFKVHILNNGNVSVESIGKQWFHLGAKQERESCSEWITFEAFQNEAKRLP